VNREVLIFKDAGVTLQMFHAPTLLGQWKGPAEGVMAATGACFGKAAADRRRETVGIVRPTSDQGPAGHRGNGRGTSVSEVGADDGHESVALSGDLNAPSSMRHPISCQAHLSPILRK
jgi:hypothetical protein